MTTLRNRTPDDTDTLLRLTSDLLPQLRAFCDVLNERGEPLRVDKRRVGECLRALVRAEEAAILRAATAHERDEAQGASDEAQRAFVRATADLARATGQAGEDARALLARVEAKPSVRPVYQKQVRQAYEAMAPGERTASDPVPAPAPVPTDSTPPPFAAQITAWFNGFTARHIIELRPDKGDFA